MCHKATPDIGYEGIPPEVPKFVIIYFNCQLDLIKELEVHPV
jgi:hypothetical protein